MAFAAEYPVGANFLQTSTTPKYEVGQRGRSTGGQEWLYVRAAEAITIYNAVGVDEDNLASKLTKAMADDGWQIGAAQIGFASGEYGWVCTRGATGPSDSVVKVTLASACNADVALYTTGTAGVLDDASTSQTKIEGIVSTTTITAATSTEVIMTWPRSAGF